jgi:hypothetical protein
LALRAAGANVADLQSQAINSAAQMRAAEQARAREALVEAMQGVRSQEGSFRLNRFGQSVDAANKYADAAGQMFRDVGQLDLGRAGLTMRGQEANQAAGLRAAALDAEREQAARQAMMAALGGMSGEAGALYGVQAQNQKNRQALLDAFAQAMTGGQISPFSGGGSGGGVPVMGAAGGGASPSALGSMLPGGVSLA